MAGIASSPSGFNRAFRTAANGASMQEIGTLGGDESWAYAINNAGQVAGTSSSLSIDTHAFLFTDGAGMAVLGNDGFLYAMGGDNPANGNNGLTTVEKIDTGIVLAPQIISSAGTTVQVGNPFGHKAIALGNPRPTFSLVTAPTGMTLDTTSGALAWTPAENQVGNNTVVVRATSTAGIGEQTFTIAGTPIPGDITRPIAPASLSLAFRTASSVTLTWPAGSDEVGVVSCNIYGLFRGSRSSHITVESSDTLSTPNWLPVPPAAQWPSASTHIVITPEAGVAARFYRVKATTVP